MPIDLMMTGFKGLSADEYRKHIAAVNAAGHWPVNVITNHDIVRSYTRYADGKHNDDIAKMMAALYLTLRGSAIMYYGEEIGMENNDRRVRTTCRTASGSWMASREGRDGEHADAVESRDQCGFSVAKPWLPVPISASTHNVADEMKDLTPFSVFTGNFTLRHSEAALLDGDYVSVNENNPNVLTYFHE
jgi:alpha-glucosidase